MPPAKILPQVPDGSEIVDLEEFDITRQIMWIHVKKGKKVSRVCVKVHAGLEP